MGTRSWSWSDRRQRPSCSASCRSPAPSMTPRPCARPWPAVICHRSHRPRSNDAAAEGALISGRRTLVEAMDHEHVDRLVTLSAAAVDVPGDRKPWLDPIASSVVRRAARHVVAAKQGEFEVLSASSLAWTVSRPAIVTDGPARGYRLSETLRPGARVTRADVGRALVDVLDDRTQVGKAPFLLPACVASGLDSLEPRRANGAW